MKPLSSGIGYQKPFPHIVVDNFIDEQTVAAINEEWPENWNKEDGSFTKKWSSQDLPPSARSVVAQIDIKALEAATGIQGLIPDPELYGAGLHCIPRGGFLNMHCDFNQHPKGWHRRINFLIYLNERWEADWNGQLQLGLLDEAKRIAPIGGRAVIFDTNDLTWHGHPEPLACPEHIQRRSLALYFYTEKPPKEAPHSTIYKKRARR